MNKELPTVKLSDGREGVRALLEVRVIEPASQLSTLNPQPVLDFISSTAALDRYKEIIEPSGWRLDNYRKNPVVQNAHKYGDVRDTIGKALITEVHDGALFQRIEFAVDANPIARIAYNLYKGGFLRGVSVGFIPLRWENGGPDTDFRRRFLEQELLEVSAVAIPANPEALQLTLKSGTVRAEDAEKLLSLVTQTGRAGTPVPASASGTNPGAQGTERPTDQTNLLRDAQQDGAVHAAPPPSTSTNQGENKEKEMKEEGTVENAQVIGDITAAWPCIKTLPDELKSVREQLTTTADELKRLRRGLVMSPSVAPAPRPKGRLSDKCARHVAAHFIAHVERSGRLEALAPTGNQRDSLTSFAVDELGLSTRAALTTTEIPLPSQYSGEIRELISEFGVVRQHLTYYPLGQGTARPARMGTRPTFGSIAMSGAFPERSPSFEFASLESHKLGGLVRVPRELDEQSIVPMAQFLARYAAIEFARAEDTWGFLADGTGTYENVKGIVQVCRDNTKTYVLAATKTHPSDAVLADFRGLRLKVAKAALNSRSVYCLDSTWESRLPTFNSADEPYVYRRLPDGSAYLDGYRVVWTDVLTAYGTGAAADTPLAVFGAPEYWWFAEKGSPRIDTSEHVFFVNDQLAVRCAEEIDFDYIAVDAMATLLTAAA